jgi:hypothetical protein
MSRHPRLTRVPQGKGWIFLGGDPPRSCSPSPPVHGVPVCRLRRGDQGVRSKARSSARSQGTFGWGAARSQGVPAQWQALPIEGLRLPRISSREPCDLGKSRSRPTLTGAWLWRRSPGTSRLAASHRAGDRGSPGAGLWRTPRQRGLRLAGLRRWAVHRLAPQTLALAGTRSAASASRRCVAGMRTQGLTRRATAGLLS